MDDDDPDILAFCESPPPRRRIRLGRARFVVAAGLSVAGLAVAGLAVAGLAFDTVGGGPSPKSPVARPAAVQVAFMQAGTAGFLRAELPVVQYAGQTDPMSSTHCHHR